MGSGGGGGFATKKIWEGGNDLLGSVADVATQYMTFGTVGFDNKSGKFEKGVVTRGADEALGEITGRNMARDQVWLAEQRLKREESDRARMLADEANKRQQEDIAASFAAQGARNTAGSRGGRSMRFQPLGEETDFLGL